MIHHQNGVGWLVADGDVQCVNVTLICQIPISLDSMSKLTQVHTGFFCLISSIKSNEN